MPFGFKRHLHSQPLALRWSHCRCGYVDLWHMSLYQKKKVCQQKNFPNEKFFQHLFVGEKFVLGKFSAGKFVSFEKDALPRLLGPLLQLLHMLSGTSTSTFIAHSVPTKTGKGQIGRHLWIQGHCWCLGIKVRGLSRCFYKCRGMHQREVRDCCRQPYHSPQHHQRFMSSPSECIVAHNIVASVSGTILRRS